MTNERGWVREQGARRVVPGERVRRAFGRDGADAAPLRPTGAVEAFGAQREWARRLADVDAAIAEGASPASERAQALAARWSALIEEFTGGDPGILENLNRLYADHANCHENSQKPLGNDAIAFNNRPR